MDDIAKVKCPACLGNIAMDTKYYRELGGDVIDCPHCRAKIRVPEVVQPPPKESLDEAVVTVRDLRTTQPILPVAGKSSPGNGPAKESTGAFCQHCGAEVGVRDLVCTSCERELRPANSPVKK
ncbi:hypothetical protein ACFLQU_01120 [Verrucomicrobiota bacterium]